MTVNNFMAELDRACATFDVKPHLSNAAHLDNIIRSVAEIIAIGVMRATDGEGRKTPVRPAIVALPAMAGAALKAWLGDHVEIDDAVARVTKG
jgi:hypothetical protein